jgi:hypothetical protein
MTSASRSASSSRRSGASTSAGRSPARGMSAPCSSTAVRMNCSGCGRGPRARRPATGAGAEVGARGAPIPCDAPGAATWCHERQLRGRDLHRSDEVATERLDGRTAPSKGIGLRAAAEQITAAGFAISCF